MAFNSVLKSRANDLTRIDEKLTEILALVAHLHPVYFPDVAAAFRAAADNLSPLGATVGSANTTEEVDDSENEHVETTAETATGTAERMQEFFRKNGNAPSTVTEISEGAGVNLQTVRSILYKRNRGRFIQKNIAGSGNTTYWCCTDQFLLDEFI